MNILFINSSGKCNFFFSAQLNNNSYKKIIQPMGSTRPNPTHVGWVELMWWVGLGWIFCWPTMVGWVKKSSQSDTTQLMHTPNTNTFGEIIRSSWWISDVAHPSTKCLFVSTFSTQKIFFVIYSSWVCMGDKHW